MARDFDATIGLEKTIETLTGLFKGSGAIITIVGGISIIAYGNKKRVTYDIDAEVNVKDKKFIDNAIIELEKLNLPADISDNVSRWGMIDIPSGYRDRTVFFRKVEDVEFRLLSPLDLIISKLRIFRDVDVDDAIFIADKFNVTIEEIKNAAQKSIQTSPRSTDLINFKKRLDYFAKELMKRK